MTPGEAENFHEEDEDPQKILARFDAARQLERTRRYRRYIQETYGGVTEPPDWYSRGMQQTGNA
jgi:hypothetical protein